MSDAGYTTSHLEPNLTLPLVVRPDCENVETIEWAKKHASSFEEKLLECGAILFRGLDMKSVADFEQFASAICPSLYGDYGDLPRESMGEKVYESTPYPKDKAILFHNESSHMPSWPLKQWFYCAKAAPDRGETPIVDCRKIYQLLDDDVVHEFTEKKLMYVRNFIHGLDVDWQEFFRTDDKAEVESKCRDSHVDCEWTDDGLRLRQLAAAVARHPKTGEMTFFNQIQLHHSSYLDDDIRESLMLIYGEEGMPRNVYFGDGSPIDASLVKEIEQLYWDNSVQFPWQEGDVLMVDNMLVAHARNPFSGPRKIVVAMGEIITQDAI